jgi:hypothetical protein
LLRLFDPDSKTGFGLRNSAIDYRRAATASHAKELNLKIKFRKSFRPFSRKGL